MKNQPYTKRFLMHLLAGILVFGTMTLTLGEISEDVINREPLTVIDAQLGTWLHAHATPSLTSAMLVSTSLGSTIAPIKAPTVRIIARMPAISR